MTFLVADGFLWVERLLDLGNSLRGVFDFDFTSFRTLVLVPDLLFLDESRRKDFLEVPVDLNEA